MAYCPLWPFFLDVPWLDIRERINISSSFMAGMSNKKITIMIKLRMITSMDGVEPRKSAAKITEKITIYIIAMEATMTIYEKTLSQIEERLSERYRRIV